MTIVRGSSARNKRSLVRSGDIVRVDFGDPIGSSPAKVRPAIIVTANQTLAVYAKTLHVVPVTSNVDRAWSTDVRLEDSLLPRVSTAQCHLCSVIDHSQIVADTRLNVGPTYLAQIRSVLADLLDLP